MTRCSSYRSRMPVFAVLASGFLLSLPAAQAQEFESPLMAADRSGVPEGQTSGEWMGAQGKAVASAEGTEHVVTVEASGLVSEGLYTVWWVNPGVFGMDMGPGGGLPDNEFRADADGNAEVDIRVPAENDYRMMVIAFHADDTTHGEKPGEMGKVAFEHLMGAWPGPAGEAPNM
jgi:hypothetical protein